MTVSDCFVAGSWPLCVAYLWTVLRMGCGRVCGLFFFIAYIWTVGCADMLDCVLIYVDITCLDILTWIDVNYMRLI